MNRSTKKRGFRRGIVASGMLLGLLAVASTGAFAQAAAPEEVYALTKSDDLLVFNGASPNDTERIAISGLRNNDSLVGIDFRPSSQTPALQNALYGVGSQGTIYTIDPDTGQATFRTALFQADSTGAITQPRQRARFTGSNFGVDFNPTVDRLRVVSEDNENFRINVETGATITDGMLRYVDNNSNRNPWVTAAAYTNSQPGAFNPPGTTANTTQLLDIDSGLDILAQQVDANGGTLAERGPLGNDVKLNTGFDIVTTGGMDQGYAALQIKRPTTMASGFFRVNLQTGDVSGMGRINGGRTMVEGLAIPTGGVPVQDGGDAG